MRRRCAAVPPPRTAGRLWIAAALVKGCPLLAQQHLHHTCCGAKSIRRGCALPAAVPGARRRPVTRTPLAPPTLQCPRDRQPYCCIAPPPHPTPPHPQHVPPHRATPLALWRRFSDNEVQRDAKLVSYQIVDKSGKPYVQGGLLLHVFWFYWVWGLV